MNNFIIDQQCVNVISSFLNNGFRVHMHHLPISTMIQIGRNFRLIAKNLMQNPQNSSPRSFGAYNEKNKQRNCAIIH